MFCKMYEHRYIIKHVILNMLKKYVHPAFVFATGFVTPVTRGVYLMFLSHSLKYDSSILMSLQQK